MSSGLTCDSPWRVTLAEVMVQVFSGKYPPPSKHVEDLPATVDAFFQRAFARKPDERYQSIADLHNAFVAVVAGKPLPPQTTAPPASPSAPSVPMTSLTTSSPSWPGVAAPGSRPDAVSTLPNPAQSPPVPTNVVAPSLSVPERDAVRSSQPPGPQPPAPRPSTSGLSAPPERAMSSPALTGFGIPNHCVHPSAAWQEHAPPLRTLPDDPATEPIPEKQPQAPTNQLGVAAHPVQGADPRRVRAIVIAVVAALAVLATVVVIALSGPSDSGDKRAADAATSASLPITTSPSAGATTDPIGPTATGSAITPDEIARAVVDETPVEVVPDEPPAPAPSATQAPKSNWKAIGKGQARLLISAKGGVCKITINSTYYGVTPLDVMVDAGTIRVFCRMSTGTTRSKTVSAPEYKLTIIKFDVKQ